MNPVSLTAVGNLRSVGAKKVGFSGRQLGFKADNSVDSVEVQKAAKPHKIGGLRVLFSRLTNEQINAVNESRKLPDNAKFVKDGTGGYAISNNFFGIRAGTKTLPDDYELKKNFLGFTIVVPKDTKGLFIKDAKK